MSEKTAGIYKNTSQTDYFQGPLKSNISRAISELTERELDIPSHILESNEEKVENREKVEGSSL